MRVLLFVLMLLSCLPARAEFMSGLDLLVNCKSTSTIDRIDCLGYITGVADVFVQIEWCPPQGITRGQIRDQVVSDMQNLPKLGTSSADTAVLASLSVRWPCQRRQDQPAPSNQRLFPTH